MEVTCSSQAAPGDRPNDDFVIATERYVVLLDGATAPAGVDSGCIHDVPWLVAQLGTQIARVLSTELVAPLVEVLRSGIEATMASHADTCDLTNRDSPSTTAAILRQDGERLEYAVLGDSAVVVEWHGGELVVGHDDRTSYLPAYTVEAVSQARNTEEGFWIASIRPEAADRAVTGALPLSEVNYAAVMTDGITRLVERYGWSWADLLKRLESHGPAQLVRDIRAEERATPAGRFRGKVHDDATAVFCRF